MRFVLLAVGWLLSGTLAVNGQASPRFQLTDLTLNEGGNPDGVASPASANHRLSLDALGASVTASGTPSGPTVRIDVGFVAAYPPPGEVRGLSVDADKRTLRWAPEPSVGAYLVYRDALHALPGSYGICVTGELGTESWNDPETPLLNEGLYYLVTARNRLGEEGSKGRSGAGTERPNEAPCP